LIRLGKNWQDANEARGWDDQHGKLVDLSAFQRDILRLIQDVPLSGLQRATGLSLRYVSLIRRGERTPHPRPDPPGKIQSVHCWLRLTGASNSCRAGWRRFSA
jgi:hypothetical protein